MAHAVADRTLMPGGSVEQNPETEDIKKLATLALAEYNKKSTDAFPYVLKKIISVKSRVVSGASYDFELEVVPNKNCKKDEVCTGPIPTDVPSKIIGVNVISRPWDKGHEQTVTITKQ